MKKTIEIEVYYDNKGRPTCSRSIEKKCEFLMYSRFGMERNCFYSMAFYLTRYDEIGCLKPSDKCRLHNADN